MLKGTTAETKGKKMKKGKVSADLAGKPFSMETGVLALQADGSVLARLGDTVVLATAVMMYRVANGQPLSVLEELEPEAVPGWNPANDGASWMLTSSD